MVFLKGSCTSDWAVHKEKLSRANLMIAHYFDCRNHLPMEIYCLKIDHLVGQILMGNHLYMPLSILINI